MRRGHQLFSKAGAIAVCMLEYILFLARMGVEWIEDPLMVLAGEYLFGFLMENNKI